jgi:hypothetical protein
MTKKYELVMYDRDTGRYRIRALRDFGDAVSGFRAGDLGGWVTGEHNLSQEGDCWIFGNAKVTGNAQVSGNARVYENAFVLGIIYLTPRDIRGRYLLMERIRRTLTRR